MGCFIISRTPSGDRFLLQSDAGRTLVTSRDYATLDACKKGICSLVYYAPMIPIVDASAGECGPNPKFEVTADEGGALYYCMKSANGKSVVQDGPFATKKACLRAISMLRAGVQNAQVFFARPGGFDRLTVGGLVQDDAVESAYAQATPQAQPTASPTVQSSAEAVPDVAQKTVTPSVKTPHRIHTAATVQAPKSTAVKPKPKQTAKADLRSPAPKSLLSRLFKR